MKTKFFKNKKWLKIFLLFGISISIFIYLDYYFALRFFYLNKYIHVDYDIDDPKRIEIFYKRKKVVELLKTQNRNVVVDELVSLLKKEIERPTSTVEWSEYDGFTGSSSLKRYYMFALTGSDSFYNEKKLNTKVIPYIKEYVKKEQGELRDRLIITLGFLKDKSVFNDIIDLMLNAKDNEIRYLAISALRGYDDKRAIPALKKALNDTYCRKCIRSYCEFPIKCPIREEAYLELFSEFGFIRVPPYGFNLEVYNVKEMTTEEKQKKTQKELEQKQEYESYKKRNEKIASLSLDEITNILEKGTDEEKISAYLFVMEKSMKAQTVEENMKWRQIEEKYYYILNILKKR